MEEEGGRKVERRRKGVAVLDQEKLKRRKESEIRKKEGSRENGNQEQSPSREWREEGEEEGKCPHVTHTQKSPKN